MNIRINHSEIIRHLGNKKQEYVSFLLGVKIRVYHLEKFVIIGRKSKFTIWKKTEILGMKICTYHLEKYLSLKRKFIYLRPENNPF